LAWFIGRPVVSRVHCSCWLRSLHISGVWNIYGIPRFKIGTWSLFRWVVNLIIQVLHISSAYFLPK
jgi:hypothetical protein